MYLRNALILICGFSLTAMAVAQTSTTGAAPAAVSTPATAPATPVQAAPTAPAAPISPVPVAAQGVPTGGTRVHGTITDPDGELIPGATVTFTPAKGNGVKVAAGSDGTYSVSLAPGTYTLLVTMPGFAAYSVVNLKIPSVPSTTVDASLKVGEQTQVVNVDANAITLSVDPDSNASAMVLTGKDLDALSDDPDELSAELTALAGPSAGPNGGQIYVDGFTGGQLPPKSSIREIRINQNPFSAEYDKLGYGRVEVFTKPGTDKIHGSFQINGNPSQFNSGNPPVLGNTSQAYQPPYHTIFMFGSLTGPLSKSMSYSIGGSHRDIEEDQYTNATLLLPYVTPTTMCSVVICTQQYQALSYFPQVRTDINPRLDFALGDKNVLTVRYQFVDNSSVDDGPGGFNLPSYSYNSTSQSNIVQASDTQNFSSRLINETRFEYEREHTSQVASSTAPTVSVSGAFTTGGYSGQNQSDHQDHWEVQNYTSLQLKKNFLRMGGRLRINREAQDSRAGTNGTLTYAGLDNATSSSADTYQSGNVEQFSYTVINVPNVEYSLADLGLYAETDWKPLSNLTVSYGIRYETQNHLTDHHDIAPRLSFAYGIGGTKTAPRTVIRGGFGMFYDRFGQSQVLTLARQGVNTNILTAYTVQSASLTGCTPTTLSVCVADALSAGAGAKTTYQATSDLRTPYVTQFAIGADEQVGRYGTISVNFLHTQGVHQLATQNIGYSPAAAAKDMVPSTYQYFSEGAFNQNQLIINGHVQTSKWVSLFGYYSENSAHGDTNGNGSFISTPGDIQADYGRTSFAVRSRLFLGGSVTLPKFIQVSPFMIAQSGNPYNITEGQDINDDTVLNDRPWLVPTGANPSDVSISGCGTFLSRTISPTVPAGGRLVPVNYCTGPALFMLNLRLTKTIGFGSSTAPKPTGAGQAQGGPGSGQHQHNGGGGHGGPGGGGGGPFGGGGTNTGKRYNVAFGLQVQNLFNNDDLATPQGTLTSPYFGQSTQLAGQPYTTSNALRRITMQASFNF